MFLLDCRDAHEACYLGTLILLLGSMLAGKAVISWLGP